MDNSRLVRLSNFLSTHLRHRPERLGMQLQPSGWVAIDILMGAAERVGTSMTRTELDHVVGHNDQQRFSIDAAGARIRANQGHSVAIDLQLSPTAPPHVLYHGTGR